MKSKKNYTSTQDFVILRLNNSLLSIEIEEYVKELGLKYVVYYTKNDPMIVMYPFDTTFKGENGFDSFKKYYKP